MEGLNAYQRQQLVDLKNKLLDEANQQWDEASIEHDKIEEAKLLVVSNSKMNIAKIIENIIYNQ